MRFPNIPIPLVLAIKHAVPDITQADWFTDMPPLGSSFPLDSMCLSISLSNTTGDNLVTPRVMVYDFSMSFTPPFGMAELPIPAGRYYDKNFFMFATSWDGLLTDKFFETAVPTNVSQHEADNHLGVRSARCVSPPLLLDGVVDTSVVVNMVPSSPLTGDMMPPQVTVELPTPFNFNQALDMPDGSNIIKAKDLPSFDPNRGPGYTGTYWITQNIEAGTVMCVFLASPTDRNGAEDFMSTVSDDFCEVNIYKTDGRWSNAKDTFVSSRRVNSKMCEITFAETGTYEILLRDLYGYTNNSLSVAFRHPMSTYNELNWGTHYDIDTPIADPVNYPDGRAYYILCRPYNLGSLIRDYIAYKHGRAIVTKITTATHVFEESQYLDDYSQLEAVVGVNAVFSGILSFEYL